MKKFAPSLALFVFASCSHLPTHILPAHIPFFKHAPKEPEVAAVAKPTPVPKEIEHKSAVVAPAPDFTFDAAGKGNSLRSLRGRAVVIVFARDAGGAAKQAKELAPVYQEFAARGVIFIAALKEVGGLVKSDIPFVIANDGAGVAAKFGVTGKFAIAIIGPDGNIDYQTDKVLPGGRVRDVIQNSFTVQTNARKH